MHARRQPGEYSAFAKSARALTLEGLAPPRTVQGPRPTRPARGRLLPTDALRHQSILAYANFRYLKLATVVLAGAIFGYIWYVPSVGRYGGSAAGYTLGTVAALLILWLLWFGLRKRQFRSTTGSL